METQTLNWTTLDESTVLVSDNQILLNCIDLHSNTPTIIGGIVYNGGIKIHPDREEDIPYITFVVGNTVVKTYKDKGYTFEIDGFKYVIEKFMYFK